MGEPAPGGSPALLWLTRTTLQKQTQLIPVSSRGRERLPSTPDRDLTALHKQTRPSRGHPGRYPARLVPEPSYTSNPLSPRLLTVPWGGGPTRSATTNYYESPGFDI